jgi:hypothetical protein
MGLSCRGRRAAGRLFWQLIRIELVGDTKEIGSLVNANTYSAVDAEIGLLLVSLLPSRFRVKQAQIELSRDDDRHRVVKDRIYHK